MTDAVSLNGSAAYHDVASRLPGWLTDLLGNEDIEAPIHNRTDGPRAHQ